MSIWQLILLLVVLGLVGLMLYVRFAPLDVAKYLEPPKLAKDDGKPHSYRLINDDAPVFDVSADKLAKMTDDVIMQEPRVTRVEGDAQSLDKGYVQRSALMGYPDYISIQIESVDADHARLNIFSRSRYGKSDMGVNKKRVEAWLSAIQAKVNAQ